MRKMRITGQISLGLLALGLGGALRALPALASSPACVLLCPPVTPAAPTSGAVTVSDVGPTSAMLSARLDPGGQSTSYYFLLSAAQGGAAQTTATQTLAATTPTTVNLSDDRLEPNSRYYAQLVAQNDNGPDTGPLGNPFATPVAPPLPIRVTIHANRYLIGTALSFTGITAGSTSIDSADAGYLQDAPVGSSRFVRYTDPLVEDAPSLQPNGRVSFAAVAIRNARWRAALSGENNGGAAAVFADGPIRQPSFSRPVTIYVYPLLSFGTDRPNNGLRITVGASAVVHRLRRGYVGEPVYIYIASSAHGPWRRIGAPRLRPAGSGEFPGSENLHASLSYPDPNAVYVNGCVRHQILPDMGTPFSDHACGARTLRRFG
jgi:hypothetical protein